MSEILRRKGLFSSRRNDLWWVKRNWQRARMDEEMLVPPEEISDTGLSADLNRPPNDKPPGQGVKL